MEYRTEEENGDAAWYKLVGDRNTPVKVRYKEYNTCRICKFGPPYPLAEKL